MKGRLIGMAGACLLAACSSTGPGGERFLAVMSGLNEVPPITAAVSAGTASFTVAGDHVDFVITVQGITGVTDARLQSGAAGEIGPVLVDLYNGPTTGTITSGTLTSGTITASNLTALSLDSLKTLMRTGHAYVNVTTSGVPSGEIRGQIFPN